jgi:hypothetical protein
MKYFISYQATKGGNSVIGRCDFTTTEPIHSSDRIAYIEDALMRHHGYNSVTVTFWTRFEDQA